MDKIKVLETCIERLKEKLESFKEECMSWEELNNRITLLEEELDKAYEDTYGK